MANVETKLMNVPYCCPHYNPSQTVSDTIISTFFAFLSHSHPRLTLFWRSRKKSSREAFKRRGCDCLHFYAILLRDQTANSMCAMMMVLRMVKQNWVQLASDWKNAALNRTERALVKSIPKEKNLREISARKQRRLKFKCEYTIKIT